MEDAYFSLNILEYLPKGQKVIYLQFYLQQSKNKSKKKKIKCFIGNQLSEECGLNWFKGGDEGKLIEFIECNDNDGNKKHLASLGIPEESIIQCPKATEKELIKVRSELLEIPENALICTKHRLKFGIGWKPPALSCKYPGHKKNKSKGSQQKNRRNIPFPKLSEISYLFSSPINGIVVPVGSKWCNDCRLRTHKSLF